MTSTSQFSELFLGQVEVDHYRAAIAQSMFHDVQRLEIGVSPAKLLHQDLFRSNSAYRTDPSIGDRIEEDHGDMGGHVLDGGSDASRSHNEIRVGHAEAAVTPALLWKCLEPQGIA